MKKPGLLGVLVLLAAALSTTATLLGAARLMQVKAGLADGVKDLRELISQQQVAGAALPGADGQSSAETPSLGDGETALAILTFVDAKEAAAVYAGTDTQTLEKGIGLAADTATLNEPGNAVLFGHRDSACRAMESLAPGDEILVETLAGSCTYRVTEKYITDPYDPDIYAPSEDTRITIVTCYPFRFVGPAPERCVVVAIA
jgi:sortase A